MKISMTILALCALIPAHAQITDPGNLVSPPPQSAIAHHASQPEDLYWLWQFTEPAPNGSKSTLFADPRWSAMLSSELTAPQAFWGLNPTLSDAASTFLSGPGQVRGTKNRYLEITGCVPGQCAQRGLLWIDIGTPNPLVVFCAMRWSEASRTTDDPKAPYTLWIFPSHTLSAQHLPEAFKLAIGSWVYGANYSLTPNIVQSILVDTNGGPHVLQPNQINIHPNTKNE